MRARFVACLAVIVALALAACADLGVASSAPAASPAPTAGGSTPVPSASPSFVRPTPNPSPTFLVYEVRRGDTLTAIAREFGTTARSIAYWNRDQYPSLDPDAAGYEPDRITVGWNLRLIPTAVFDEEELLDATPSPGASAPPDEASPTPS
jgi:nucleoid-associated protein YgaU